MKRWGITSVLGMYDEGNYEEMAGMEITWRLDMCNMRKKENLINKKK